MHGIFALQSAIWVVGVLLLCSGIAEGQNTALPHPPNAVEVLSFDSDKVMYNAGESVTFRVHLRVGNANPSLIPAVTPLVSPPLVLEVWDACGLRAPAKVAEARLAAAGSAPVEASLSWTPVAQCYGHLATLRVFDGAGRELARTDTLYEVTEGNWQYLLRYASIAGSLGANEQLTQADLERIVAGMRTAQLNALELFAWMPESYELSPNTPRWKSLYYRRDTDLFISAEKLTALGKLLHANGMKLLAYNETSVLDPALLPPGDDPESYKIYEKQGDGHPQLVAPYKTSERCFQPNCLKVADMFSRELSASVRRFDWDGVLMDSALWGFYATATGVDARGKPLTTLTPGQVGERYLAPARARVHAVKPGFRFICQNAFASLIGRDYHWKLPRDEQFATLERYIRDNYREVPDLVDAWSAELDPHYEPQQNYPQTFEQYIISMNAVRELTGKPLLQWTQVAAPYAGDYTDAYAGALLSALGAGRVSYNDHFSNYGGLLGPWSNAPTNQRQLQINRFLTRYSQYLRAPELRWIRDPSTQFTVKAKRELCWKSTVYQQETAEGFQWIVNLLNLDSPYVRPQNMGAAPHAIPPAAFPVIVSWQPEGGVPEGVQAYALDAEDASLCALPLEIERGQGQVSVALPPIRSWMVLVFTLPGKGK